MAALDAARLTGLASALFDPYALRSNLLGSEVLPIYRRAEEVEEVGKLFDFEQRFFLAHVGITDGVKWRKHEKRRGGCRTSVMIGSCLRLKLLFRGTRSPGFRRLC